MEKRERGRGAMSMKVDTSAHLAMCRQIAGLTGVPFERVVDYEVVKIVEKAVALVPAAKISSLEAGANYQGRTPAERSRLLKLKKAARGLAKQGLWLIGKLLGFVPNAPAYVARAQPSDGKTYEDVSARRRSLLGAYQVVVESRQPTLQAPYVRGDWALARAITGRVRYFEQNLKRKVFESVTAIAKRYPGVRTSK